MRLFDPEGALVGHGVFDPASPIAVRVWTQGDVRIDAALVGARLAAAFDLRAALFDDGGTDAYRALHGEGDRVPGFVIDRYGDVAVLRVDGDAARARRDALVEIAWPELARRGARSLLARSGERGALPELLRGPMPERHVTVKEHGVPFVVDVHTGQKTGAFLDQRDNRKRVGELARGRRVLNLFSYAGGFSLHAARGGATHVTSVDIAAQAHAAAQASFRAAGLDLGRHELVAADAFAFLESAKRRGDTWELVVCDPPSFAPSEKALPRALAAYRSLHRACAEVLAPGAIFCAASCSSHVDARAFAATLDDATLGRADLRLVELHGPPPDHPTLAAWPEGRYLKFAVLR